ncbi:MAG TPA: pyruvate carboxylase subunit B, partial [Chromatiales bacterium]|nr:pyruvate carboxylase subunit B [Chromatiales bacterium]
DVPRFVEMARALETMGCDSIVVKDMAGLLTPMVAGELFRALHAAVRVPLHLHSHNSAGLAYMSHLKAIDNGCSHIDTAISAFADGPSHPATESLVAALQGTEYDTGLDLALLQSISAYFLEVRRKYRRFEGEYAVPDTRVQTNQVPGGMISNLYQQLREQDALGRLDEVLAEIPRVREDLGYPPLVTPTSQIVGTQALLNVLTRARYKTITNEVKLYLQGRYGKAPGPINEWVRQLAIGNAEVMEARPADALPPEMDALREAAGILAASDEDVMTLAMFPELGREFLEQRAAGTLMPEPLQIPGTETAEPAAVPTEFNVTLHGETYHIKVTGSGHHTRHQRPFYVYVDGMPEEILVEALDGPEEAADSAAPGRRTTVQGSRRPRPSGPGHVTAAMPGTIVEVRVQPGDTVQAGDPLLVSEAMKMETEVQAPIAGTVAAVYVAKGDKVNPDETLIEIRP